MSDGYLDKLNLSCILCLTDVYVVICISIYLSLSIYIYIYIYICREREIYRNE